MEKKIEMENLSKNMLAPGSRVGKEGAGFSLSYLLSTLSISHPKTCFLPAQ